MIWTKIPTHLSTSTREQPKAAILETCCIWYIWSEWTGDMIWSTIWFFYDLTNYLICFYNFDHFNHFWQFWQLWQFWQFWQQKRQQQQHRQWQRQSKDLWHLRHWLQFWQLRTWIHDNLCYLTINCDTGQHSQFLRCFPFQGLFIQWILSIWTPSPTTIDEQLLTKFSFFFFSSSEVLYSIGLFNLDTKPELLLDLLVGHLHALVLVRPTLLVHLILIDIDI